MTIEPVNMPVQVEQQLAVQTLEQGANYPAPSDEQELVADTVFSREEQELVAGLMAAQMGLGLVHHLAFDAFGKAAVPAEQPRLKNRPEDEDSPR